MLTDFLVGPIPRFPNRILGFASGRTKGDGICGSGIFLWEFIWGCTGLSVVRMAGAIRFDPLAKRRESPNHYDSARSPAIPSQMRWNLFYQERRAMGYHRYIWFVIWRSSATLIFNRN